MGKQAIENAQRLNAFGVDPDRIIIIGLDTADDESHPLYDERIHEPLDEETVLVMDKKGWTHGAVDIRKNGDLLELVVGRGRVRCAREVNRRRRERREKQMLFVRVFERKFTSDASLVATMLAENEHRRDDRPMLKAKKCQRFLNFGASEAEAATIFKVDVATIRLWLRLFDLDNSVRKAVDDGRVPATAAAKLADLTREDQRVELEKLIAAGPVTVVATARAVRQKKTGVEQHAVPKKRVIKRVLAAHAERGKESPLDPEFVRGVRWVLGDLSDMTVKGLREMAATEG